MAVVGRVFRGSDVLPTAHRLQPDTVRPHRKNIYRKLHINHLTELVDFARENGR